MTPRKIGLLLLATGLLGLAVAPGASGATIASINARAAATGTSATGTEAVFTDTGSGIQVRCRHDITIPTSAFSLSNSVSIEAANNTYSSCRDTNGASCVVRVNGRWTITARTTTSGTVRLESSTSVDCTNRGATRYSCVLLIDSGQTLGVTFVNPVAPATTGTLRVDTPNTLTYQITSSTNCPLGDVNARGTATQAERFSTENVRIR
ncbi:MAG TPA: hypothetical protein VI111_07890 [Thermoleophilaceae bacterium]